VTSQESFGSLCQRVCDTRGWELQPTGVVVSWRDGRHQVVSLEVFEYRDQKRVRLISEIGTAEDLGEDRLIMALSANAELVHGALAFRDGQLCMTDTIRLEEADEEQLEAAIAYLAETADFYERSIFGTDEH
jgi:hypothetical protein